MTPILTLLSNPPYPDPLNSILAWAGWVVLLGVVVAAILRWRGYQRRGGLRGLLLVLFALFVPIANLFLGLRFSSGAALPEPGIPSTAHDPALMAFSALPWMLAAGFLGPLDAALVGALTGLTRCLWDTHDLFTILQPALLAALFSAAARQRYRTPVYRALRQPLFTGLALVPVHALVYVASALASVSGTLAARLDFAFTNVAPAALATGGELLIAALFVQVIAIALPNYWGRQEPLRPSPAEESLQTRFLSVGGGLIVALLIFLVLGDWIVAGSAARRMIRDRLAGAAQAATESVPFFFETGQNLATQLAADPRLLGDPGNDLDEYLGRQMRTAPFFDQLFVVGPDGDLLAAYPPSEAASFRLAQEESLGVALALQGVTAQTYTVPPAAGETAARIAFLAAIPGRDGQVQRVLLGRSALSINPLIRPLLNSLGEMQALGGDGKLLDEQGRIIYSPNPDELMTAYTGEQGPRASFSEVPAPRGTRSLVYYHPVAGRSWAVVLSLPAEQAQQLALEIAAPLTVLVLLLAAAALVSLRLSLRVVTASLQNLAGEAGRISKGRLGHPLSVEGVDEVGRLGRAFEEMRISLRARLEELNQLLLVGQGVASTLDMETAVRPILEAALTTGAAAVRVALVPQADRPGDKSPLRYALGPSGNLYAPLDEALLDMVEQRGRLALNNLERARNLDLPEGQPRPEALVAVDMYHQERRYGVLWAAFDHSNPFTEQDVRFLSTLAGYAALAAANARLFQTAEVGRQQLAAILASTPDPVLVTDLENRLILANPAARRALGMPSTAEGQPTERVIGQAELRALLQELEGGQKSAEAQMPDGRVYFATASAVIAEGEPVGRVCVMRDITHFKELDALKSDFVSTVSHDLRSPLTLMRGYATMLEMVGKLNEQQHSYVSKIIIGVESMSRMVNNLLDLSRIDAGVGLQVDRVQVMDVVEGVMAGLQLQAGQKDIRLGVETEGDLPAAIEADRALLQQAVYNLVENAIKYTPEGGRVEIRLRARPEGLIYEVRDNGIGIAPEDQPRIFEKFFRGSQREARLQRGSGLGLAMVRSIAEQHGGRVWLESQPGEGSTFYLLIPLTQPQAAKTDAAGVQAAS